MPGADSPLARLDLNLLVALDALLTERSVTRAAHRLDLGQPALSASLSRLRSLFNDEILSRQGNSYHLTPLAVRLSEHTAVALEAARRVFSIQGAWDPAQSTREFTVYGSDYGFATTGRVAARLAADRAPGVRFRFVAHTPQLVQDPAVQLRSADALLLPHGFIDDLPFTDLYTDRWVIVAADDNDAIGDVLTPEIMASSPWVYVYQSRSAFTAGTRQMQQQGIEGQVSCVVEGFMAVPAFVAGTRRLGMIQGRLAEFALRHAGVRVLEPPFESTPIINAMWWHPIHLHDPGHAWLRELFVEAGALVQQQDGTAGLTP